MNDLFDIEKFNVISDDENYYFFRSLEPGDIEDIENGVITTENGYSRLRTDRERWEERNPGKTARFDANSTVSLIEMFKKQLSIQDINSFASVVGAETIQANTMYRAIQMMRNK